MRFGVFLLCPQHPGQDHCEVLDQTVQVAVLAEQVGFDEVWVAEHHFMSYGICPSALTLAGYLLGATEHLTVGTGVSVLSTVHPVALAEQAALLDQVSGGRLHLGVGRGGPWRELEVFGTGLERFETGFAEALELLLTALRTGWVRGPGPTLRFDEVPVVPRARTPAGPPVTVAATSPATVTLAARHGLPVMLGMHADDTEKADLLARWAAAARETHGVGAPARPAHRSLHIAHVADTRAHALATVRDALPRWLGPGLAGHIPIDRRPHRPRDAHAYTDLLCELHPVGAPDDCRDRLAGTVAATGVEHLVLMVQTTADPRRTETTLRRLGAEVLPALRDLARHLL